MPAKPSTSRPSAPATPSAKPQAARASAAKGDHKILFQKYFKSIGPRTYAVQIKESNNGNHYIVLTEGKRDLVTSEIRKNRLFIYSEALCRLLPDVVHETDPSSLRPTPVSEQIKGQSGSGIGRGRKPKQPQPPGKQRNARQRRPRRSRSGLRRCPAGRLLRVGNRAQVDGRSRQAALGGFFLDFFLQLFGTGLEAASRTIAGLS